MANAVVDTENPTAETTTSYAHELDAQAYSGSDLGATYTKEATTFKVWAPTASRVAVKLYATGSPEEEGAQDISTASMVKGKNGVWSIKLDGDRKNMYYTYLITVDGVTRETADIYAKAAGVNGNRSMVVDLDSTDPEGWDKDEHVLYNDPTDAVVWEVHIKDFSNSEVSGVSMKYRGKYLAFTENGTTLNDEGNYSTCIDYLKKLGVTHVQLLPVFDYATVDEADTDSDQFNWGYDPKNYNVPEGSYSTDPFNGNTRITEFKQMIMALHNAGIGVIMDVVYNHTFTGEGSWFEMTVPGYYYRMKSDGSFSDGSGCGNETASEHLMYRKYMIDSILYWTKEYHIDGFRFDLMGVHDVTTMNEIRKSLDTNIKDGSKIIMYGEPWTGGELSTKETTAIKSNIKLLDSRIGAFNDEFRDAVKGHVFNAREKGFVQSGSSKANLQAGITANCLNNVWSNQPSQTISYISAHDNFTLYDKLVLSVKNDESYTQRDEMLVDMNKLAAALTLTSQGINFMQAGEEFARTKQGDENSHASSAKLNQLNWTQVSEYADLVSYYSGLIEIRKNFKPFRDPTKTSAELVTFADTDDGVSAYTLRNTLTSDKEWSQVAVLFNSCDTEKTVTLKGADGAKLPEKWSVVADKTEAGLREISVIEGNTVTIPARSAMVLADKESFDKQALVSDQCTVRVEYKDKDSGETISARSYKGSAGSSYSTEEDESIKLEYELDSVEGDKSGNFTKDVRTVTYFYKKFEGKVIELTVNYLKDVDELLGGGEEAAAESVTQKVREGEQYTAPVRELDGMELDLSRFPSNAVGTAGKDNISIDYHYKKREAEDLILHYYNAEGWDKVGAYVYGLYDEETKDYTDKKGKAMKADSELGKGWYSLTVKDIGNYDGIYAVFTDTNGKQDEGLGSKGFKVKGEVWIKDSDVTYSGKVNVVCIDPDGKVLKTDIMTGKLGSSYAVDDMEFDGLELSGSTSNTTGKYTEAPIYVICSYVSASEVQENHQDKTIALFAGISAGALLIAAGALYAGYRNRKKHLINE